MIKHLAIVAAVFATTTNVTALASANSQSAQVAEGSQQLPKHARKAYFGDQSTPDGIVYRSFLSRLTVFSTLSREDAVHKIVDSFKLEHDKSGTALAESLYDYFETAYYELDSEIHGMEIRTICPTDRGFRTKEQVYKAFHKVDDKIEDISNKHFRRASKELTDEEFEKLVAYVAKLKETFGYVQTDYASKYSDMPSIDVRDDAEQICAKLGNSE